MPGRNQRSWGYLGADGICNVRRRQREAVAKLECGEYVCSRVCDIPGGSVGLIALCGQLLEVYRSDGQVEALVAHAMARLADGVLIDGCQAALVAVGARAVLLLSKDGHCEAFTKAYRCASSRHPDAVRLMAMQHEHVCHCCSEVTADWHDHRQDHVHERFCANKEGVEHAPSQLRCLRAEVEDTVGLRPWLVREWDGLSLYDGEQPKALCVRHWVGYNSACKRAPRVDCSFYHEDRYFKHGLLSLDPAEFLFFKVHVKAITRAGETFSGGRYSLMSPGVNIAHLQPGDLVVARYGLLCTGSAWSAVYAALAFARGVVTAGIFALQRLEGLPSGLELLLKDVAHANNCRNARVDYGYVGQCECGTCVGPVGSGCSYGCVRDATWCGSCASVVDCQLVSVEHVSLAKGASYYGWSAHAGELKFPASEYCVFRWGNGREAQVVEAASEDSIQAPITRAARVPRSVGRRGRVFVCGGPGCDIQQHLIDGVRWDFIAQFDYVVECGPAGFRVCLDGRQIHEYGSDDYCLPGTDITIGTGGSKCDLLVCGGTEQECRARARASDRCIAGAGVSGWGP